MSPHLPLPQWTALEVAAAIRRREVSPLEVLDACLAAVDERNGSLNAVVWRDDEAARAAARAAGERIAREPAGSLPPFLGVPVPIKDLTEVAGWPVTYGSVAAPGGRSAASELVVDALLRAGFILAGRTNTPEFGPITAAENVRYGITRNPWDPGRTPGGSSGGAAAAVAGGMFPVAHGNDGGGSLRIPASCCGLVGLKVSRGRVPTRVTSWEGGSVEGVLTRDVADTAAVLDVISGPDRGCWYNAPAPQRPFLEEVGAEPGRLRFGIVDAAPLGLTLDPACADAVHAAGTLVERLGHEVVPVTVELPDDALAAFLEVVNSGLADYEGIDWARTEPHVQANLASARSVDSLTYVRAVHRLQGFTRQLAPRWGGDFDVLVTPTMTIEPPAAGDVLAAAHEAAGGVAPPVLAMAAFTGIFNLTGFPAISLPLHRSASGLPIGVQLVAGPWEDAALLRVAAQLEAAAPWRDRRPPLLGA